MKETRAIMQLSREVYRSFNNQLTYISEMLRHTKFRIARGATGLGQVFRVHEESVQSLLLPVLIYSDVTVKDAKVWAA